MRVSEPKPHEPIRLITTNSGPRYRVVIDTAGPGQRRRQVTRTLPSLKAARAFVLETRAAVTGGSFIAPTGETLQALVTRWLATRSDIRPVTLEGYSAVLVPALRRLGDRGVQSIKVGDLDALFSWLSSEGSKSGGPLKPRTVQLARCVLGMVFDLALREGTIPANPVRLARRPRTRAVVGTDLRHWQPDQLRAFVDAADDHEWAGCWRLSASGLTRADVAGLRWSDLDLTAGTATVAQGRVALLRGDAVDDPKSTARRRTVPVETVWPGTVERLRALRSAQAAARLQAGPAWTETGLVLVDVIGRGVRPEVYSDAFRRIVSAAGLPALTLHQLRHSLAHWLHQAGVAPADAAALLGHSVEVFLESYLPSGGSAGIAAAAAALARSAG